MWIKGKRRNKTDASKFIKCLIKEFGARPLSKKIGVSDRTVRRWASGEDWPDIKLIHKLVDLIFNDNQGSLPLYSNDMAIDGNTRIGGVGEFTLKASKGDTEYIKESMNEEKET